MFTEIPAQLQPIIWLVLGIILAVTEGLTVQLTAIWFALGAAAAAVTAVLGGSGLLQCFVFLIVSAGTLAGTRPFVKKVMHEKRESTNADRAIGQTGVVIQDTDDFHDVGRVTVMGLDWAARSKNGEKLTIGQKVKVLDIEGVKLIVEILQQEI